MSYTKSIAKYSIGLFLVTLVTVGVAETEAEAIINKAIAAQKKANEVGGEWRDIQKIIDEAKKAVAEDRKEDAMKLAQKSKMHSELGYRQAVSQQDKIQIPSYLQR